MFFDWLSCYQDYDFDLPIIAKDGYVRFDFETGELGAIKQSKLNHEGSYSTAIQVRVSGRRVYMSGNPSRFGRLDNLFGFPALEQCISVYNGILRDLGLPEFTKCVLQGFINKKKPSGAIKLIPIVNGLVITELHCTTNLAVGRGHVGTYLKALSMLPYRYSEPRLHTNGKTVDWLSKQGNSRELYPKVYDKAHEFRLRSLTLTKRRYGLDSDEYRYLLALIEYCEAEGAIRFEQKFRYTFLSKHNLQYWGMSNYRVLEQLHTEFLNIDEKMKVSSMNIKTITETLIIEGICSGTKAANTTALYAINWMHGEVFDGKKKQVQVHRARLRKIGIDILKPCNLVTFSPVIVKEVIEIEKRVLNPPSFYRHPEFLKVVSN